MAEISLLEKLVTVLRSRHVAVRAVLGDTSGLMTQGSAVALAEALLGTVRQHDEARGRKRDDTRDRCVQELRDYASGLMREAIALVTAGDEVNGLPKVSRAAAIDSAARLLESAED